MRSTFLHASAQQVPLYCSFRKSKRDGSASYRALAVELQQTTVNC